MEAMWETVEAQHGSVARWQMASCGLMWRDVDRFVRGGVLEVVTRRVLRARGAPRTPDQELTIAVLDAGPGGAASRRAAAWLWGVPSFPPGPNDVLRARALSSRETSGSHWPVLLPSHHLTVVRGIAVTTLARTIFDLAAMPEYAWRIGRIIDSIDGKSPSLLVALHALLPELAKRGRNGIVAMREALSTRPPDRVKLTGLERRFEHILRSAGVPVPRRQIDLGGHSWIGRVDYYDDEIKVIYEVDSIAHHSSLTDRLNDKRRDGAAIEAGFAEIVRIPEEHVWYDPPQVLNAVREARHRHRHRRAA